jgi:hypothetical protein
MTVAKMDADAIRSIATGFVAKSAEVMGVVRQAYQAAPEVYSAVTLAGQFAIEDAMTEADKAFIDRGISCGRILTEGGKPPSKEKCYSVIAEAQSKGFDLASKQYSIWTNGTLYVKEEGFRRAFSMREDCSHLDTKNEEPVWTKLQERSYWRVPVEAWVTVRGQKEPVRVKCVIGVNGNISDSISKIEAHAERSVLKKLWKKVTSIAIDADDDENDIADGSVIVIEEAKAAITEQPRDIAADNAHDAALLEASHRKGTLDRLRKILKATPDKLSLIETVYQAILDASDMKQLTEAGEALAAQKGEFSQQVLSLIRPVYESRLSEMKAGAT